MNIWKWGGGDKQFPADKFDNFKNYLENRWAEKLQRRTKEFRSETISVKPTNGDEIQKLFPKLLQDKIVVNKEIRLKHALGQSYHDILKFTTHKTFTAPDFVLFPENENDIYYILQQAHEHNIAIITFGGGTNVTGALNLSSNGTAKLTGSLNMQKLNRLLHIDPISCTATFEAGIKGPELEEQLNKQGFTLGHFPQSLEFSTLGGWIVTRSAGQQSGYYGKIEDMVLGINAATPQGLFSSVSFPRHACGIDTFKMFLGSEGTLGIVSRVQLRIHHLPEKESWIPVLFKNFSAGSQAIRKLIQLGIHPPLMRLSDHAETTLFRVLTSSNSKKPFDFIKKWIQNYLKNSGYDKPCIMLVKVAHRHEGADEEKKIIKKHLKQHGGYLLPSGSTSSWGNTLFLLPYLRDVLIEHDVLIDTFETVAYWKDIPKLYEGIHKSLNEKTDYFKKNGLLLCHISHAYQTGASLYFTLISKQEKEREIEQWLEIKNVVSEAINEHKGAISHHHGVGIDHQKWYLKNLNPIEKTILKGVKNSVDPGHILNPGKLFDVST